jgi:Domain of unknown function (DUF5655)
MGSRKGSGGGTRARSQGPGVRGQELTITALDVAGLFFARRADSGWRVSPRGHSLSFAGRPATLLAALSLRFFLPAAMVKRKRAGAGVATLPRRRAVKSTPRNSAAPCRTLYSVHPGVAMLQKWIAELKAKTSRSLDEWLEHIKEAGPRTEKECRAWLVKEYSLRTNSAWWLAERAFHPLSNSEETAAGYLALAPQYVEQMYAGARAALLPVYDELIKVARQLGDEVRICPCKTMVPLFRRHVFAQIRPATNKRIDLGLALGEEPFTSRLRDTGGAAKKDRITHAVALAGLGDIDLQVKRWLKQAYERDG